MESLVSAMSLAGAPLGQQLVVCGYRGHHPLIERLRELGLTVGTELVIRRRAPFGGGIEVEFRGLRLGLRAREATAILVCPGNGYHRDA